MKEKSLFQRVASLALAVMMVFSVFIVMPEKVGAAEFSFNSKKTISIADGQDSYTTKDYSWIKYKAPADGYLTVKASYLQNQFGSSEGYIRLYAANKKTAVSAEEIYSTNYDKSYYYTRNYGMKKGKTYYLRVESYGGVTFGSRFTKVSEKSGKSKTKAVNMKKGKTIKGVIPAGDKTVDWYKFKVTKKQYLKISYSARANDTVQFTLYKGKKSLGTIRMNFTDTSTNSTYITNEYTGKKIKVDPSSYYIKVERDNKTSSGMYSLKWS